MSAVVLLAALTAWILLKGSLPVLDGRRDLPCASAVVTVTRDSNGVVSIDAANEEDAMCALGYIHAQERYFEMDLMRRTAAGELAELLGPSALAADQKRRVHRFRYRSERGLAVFAGTHAETLRSYTQGVNAGLADLRVRPWSYLLLGQAPTPWRVEDSALVGYGMYVTLQDSSNARELALRAMRPHLPAGLFHLLLRDGTRWDAPLMGTERGDARLPTADAVDLRRLPGPTRPRPVSVETGGMPGSNNFAVAGALTSDGRAILADDMHSRLNVPNVWFRARLRYGRANARVEVSGFTLPGLPTIIAGSNGRVAWGFTNGYADTLDWDPYCGGRDTSTCARELSRPPQVETIRVKGAKPVNLLVYGGDRGPLTPDPITGQLMQLRWTAYSSEGLNLDLNNLHHAADLDEALASARGVGLPTANLMLADATGRIAWTLIGPTMRPRHASDCRWKRSGGVPQESSADRDSLFKDCAVGLEASAAAPGISDPASHRLWTANNRTLDGETLAAWAMAGMRTVRVRNRSAMSCSGNGGSRRAICWPSSWTTALR